MQCFEGYKMAWFAFLNPTFVNLKYENNEEKLVSAAPSGLKCGTHIVHDLEYVLVELYFNSVILTS
jgi:hypothetical protein